MTVKIYVANLGAYNAGHLIGEWIDLPLDAETLQERLDAILDARDEDGDLYGEELAIHDYEAPFSMSEYEPIFTVNEWAERLDAIDETDEDVIDAVLGNWVAAEDGLSCLEDGDYRVYSGCSDMGEVAAELLEETGMSSELPSWAQYYFDYDAYGRDMEIEGTFIRYDGGYVEITR